jgi:hypothetical protein
VLARTNVAYWCLAWCAFASDLIAITAAHLEYLVLRFVRTFQDLHFEELVVQEEQTLEDLFFEVVSLHVIEVEVWAYQLPDSPVMEPIFVALTFELVEDLPVEALLVGKAELVV